MVTKRKGKQKRKYLGLGSFGNGNCKNKRGAGCRGGRGNAGLSKHKFTWITVYDPDHFGKHGFVRPVGQKMDVINLFELEQKARLGKLEKKGNKFHFEFKGKILGSGNITVPLVIKAMCWSKSTEKKVNDKGGELISLMVKKAEAQ
jgi:large subunit ribosomal protein L15